MSKKLSYKRRITKENEKVIKTARRRARELERRDISSNVLNAYNFRVEWAKEKFAGDKKTLDRVLYNISNKFIKSGSSTVSEIKKRYNKKVGKDDTDIKEKAEFLDKLELLSDDILREELGSQVMKDVYTSAEINGYSTDDVRKAMSEHLLNISKDHKTPSDFTIDDLTDAIIDIIEERNDYYD